MKKLIVVIAVMLSIGCETPTSNNTDDYGYYGFRITQVDSCEYVIYSTGIAHKGNCKFCKERTIKLCK